MNFSAQLFQQSILISGSAFVPSLIVDGAREESAMKKVFDPSKEFAVEIKCATADRWAKGINDSSAIFECIRDLKDRVCCTGCRKTSGITPQKSPDS
jgi:hypothetical protein